MTMARWHRDHRAHSGVLRPVPQRAPGGRRARDQRLRRDRRRRAAQPPEVRRVLHARGAPRDDRREPRAPRARAHRVGLHPPRERRGRRRGDSDREGAAGGLGLRERAADGTNEPLAVGRGDRLHPDQLDALVHRIAPVARGRPLRGRREPLRPRARREAAPREVREPNVTSLGDEGGHPEEFEPRDAASLINQAVNVIASAKTMPLSSSVLISRDEVLALLDEAVETLPEELKRARWVLADLDAITEQRRREADALLDEVRAEAARLVSRTEISRQANAHAERGVADAEERGRAILHGAEDYCDRKLAEMEIVLDRVAKTVQSGRARLRPRIEPESTDQEGTGEDEGAFFDQDLA